MLWIIAIVNLCYAPFLFFLRNPPGKEEKQVRVMAAILSHNLCAVGAVFDYPEQHKYTKRSQNKLKVLRLHRINNTSVILPSRV